MRVDCLGNQLALYLNEQLVLEREIEGEALGPGNIALGAGGASEGLSDVYFDNLTIALLDRPVGRRPPKTCPGPAMYCAGSAHAMGSDMPDGRQPGFLRTEQPAAPAMALANGRPAHGVRDRAAAMFDLRAQLATGKQPTGSNGSLRHSGQWGRRGSCWRLAGRSPSRRSGVVPGVGQRDPGDACPPGLLLVAAGLFLAGTGVGRLLALDEQPTHRLGGGLPISAAAGRASGARSGCRADRDRRTSDGGALLVSSWVRSWPQVGGWAVESTGGLR